MMELDTRAVDSTSATAAVSTIERRVAAIAYYHRAADLPSAHSTRKVRDTLAGICRKRKKDKPARKAPAIDSVIKAMVDTLDIESATGLRDRALLLLGFAGALRRSELVALDVEDLSVRPSLGLTLTIRASKTDQSATAARPRQRAYDTAHEPEATMPSEMLMFPTDQILVRMFCPWP